MVETDCATHWIINVPDKKDEKVWEQKITGCQTSWIYTEGGRESKTQCMKLMINGHYCVQMNCCVEIIGSFFKEWGGHWNYWQQIQNTGRSNLILWWNTVFLFQLIQLHTSLHLPTFTIFPALTQCQNSYSCLIRPEIHSISSFQLDDYSVTTPLV